MAAIAPLDARLRSTYNNLLTGSIDNWQAKYEAAERIAEGRRGTFSSRQSAGP